MNRKWKRSLEKVASSYAERKIEISAIEGADFDGFKSAEELIDSIIE